MCGIAGIIGKRGAPEKAVMREMLDCVAHRGPDDEGCWGEGQVLLGHRRLAIIDLTAKGHQPMPYGERYQIVYNGEIYNYPELRQELTRKGYRFQTETDTEIIPAAYDCWGEACLERFEGMWAFALLDRHKRRLFCARDRFGIKPFYYLDSAACFCFGSEIKQLLPFLEGKPKANRKALSLFLAVGYMDYGEETMFERVRQLRGGHRLLYDVETHRYEMKQWFDVMDEKPQSWTDEQAISAFRDAFRRSVAMHLRSDVRLGSCLSGGLDSSAIVCEAYRQLRQSPDSEQYTVSSCFEDRRYDERVYMDAVKAKCPNLKEKRVFPDMDELFSSLDDMIWHMDEPFGSTSVYAQWRVFQAAGENGLKVMLDGQGADEQLAGYTDFYKLLFVWLWKKGKWIRLANEARAYHRLRARSEPQGRLRFFGVTALEALTPVWLQSRLFARCLKTSPNRAWVRLDREALKEACAVKRRYAKRDPRLFAKAFLENGMSELLHYEDRNSMAFSVEARVPFLDAKLSSLTFSMPLSLKLRGGVTKWVLREALKEELPAEVYKRYSKLGFVTPENQWLTERRRELRPEMEKAVQTLAPLLQPERTLRWYDRQSAIQRGDSRVWRILCAARWANVFSVEV